MRDGTLSFADPDMLDRQFKNNAESLRSFFKDQIISDNSDIIPKRYSIADTKPGSYAVSVSSGTATVGGVSTSQSGSIYTVASGDPNGIALEINSSNTTGTVHYGRSFITLLQDKLDTFLKFNGLISSKVTVLTNVYLSWLRSKKIWKIELLVYIVGMKPNMLLWKVQSQALMRRLACLRMPLKETTKN